MPLASPRTKNIKPMSSGNYSIESIFILLLLMFLIVGCEDSPTAAVENNEMAISLENPKLITTEQGLERDQVYALTSCPNGDVWFAYGVNAGGITRLSDNAYETFTTQDGLQLNYVHALACDANNIVWIGYGINAGGLSAFDGESFTNFTTDDGLHSNYVSSITVEPTGTIYIAYAAQFNGVTRFN